MGLRAGLWLVLLARSRFLLGWIAAVIGFFSASSFKLEYYALPAFPAIALVVAVLVCQASDGAAAGRPPDGSKGSAGHEAALAWTRISLWGGALLRGNGLGVVGGLAGWLTPTAIIRGLSFWATNYRIVLDHGLPLPPGTPGPYGGETWSSAPACPRRRGASLSGDGSSRIAERDLPDVYAGRRSRFYGDKCAALRIDPERVRDLADLRDCETTPEELRAAPPEAMLRGRLELVVESSGTSERLTRLYLSHAELEYYARQGVILFAMMGAGPAGRILGRFEYAWGLGGILHAADRGPQRPLQCLPRAGGPGRGRRAVAGIPVHHRYSNPRPDPPRGRPPRRGFEPISPNATNPSGPRPSSTCATSGCAWCLRGVFGRAGRSAGWWTSGASDEGPRRRRRRARRRNSMDFRRRVPYIPRVESLFDSRHA